MLGVARRRRIWLAATALALVVGVTAPARAASPVSTHLPPLSVARDGEPRIVDAEGRHVILRAVNINQLNDYFQGNPSLPTTVPLTKNDFARLASLGFNAVRLAFNWSSLEPERDTIDEAALDRIGQAVEWAAAHGLYVVLDMHQDAWAKDVATPESEQCLPGTESAIGWDGAPTWATFLDGMATCRFEARELSSAVSQAFTSFWADRDGIRSELVELWGVIAARFADNPAVAGYDLVNEPHPGWTPGVADHTALATYYYDAISTIRAAEAGAGGFHHLVFFEPMITRAITGTPSPPPAFTDDEQIVYAPHNYAESIQVLPVGNPTIEQNFAQDASAAQAYGTTFWVGEWGFFGDPDGQRDEIERFAREEDARRVGGAWWVWKQACGDPHVVGSTGNTPDAVSPSLVRYDCPEGTELGIPPPFAEVLSRSYPRAAPGRLISFESDPATGAVSISGHADESVAGTLDVWVPRRRPSPPAVSGAGAKRATVVAVPGGFRVLVPVTGDYEVGVGWPS